MQSDKTLLNEIALEAYLYFYPLVLMEATKQVMTNTPIEAATGGGPMNQFNHVRTFPEADFRNVVRPNFDTLYSITWLDLTNGPINIHVPNTNERYYLLPILDMWTDVLAAPGSRTTGTGADTFTVVQQEQIDQIDDQDDASIIISTTPYAWIIGRIQTNGTNDFTYVNQLQDGFKITPYKKGAELLIRKSPVSSYINIQKPPMQQIDSMAAEDFFDFASELFQTNPPHVTDWSQIERLKLLGIEQEREFQFQQAPRNIQKALTQAVQAGQEALKNDANSIANIYNGWQMNTSTMGVYGTDFLKRAVVAQIGLGANLPEDAVYPLNIYDENQQYLDAANNYILHFTKDQIPPVNAFWSLTMYDGEGFQVENELNRFAIGDRDNLSFNDDGSLDIYIQHRSPGKEKESNWLPSAANGKMGITLRLYYPKREVLIGSWIPPKVQKIG